MKILLFIILSLILFSLCWSEGNNSGKLQDFEDEINQPAEQNDEEDNDDDDDHLDDEDGNFLTDLLFWITYELFIGIPVDQHDRKEFLWSYGFNEFPYSSGSTGVYDIDNNKFSYLDLSSFYFYHNKDLDGQYVKANFLFMPYLGLTGSYLNLEEKLEHGSDQFHFYDLYINYVRVRSQHVNWWWGLGVKHLSRDNNYTGFSLTTGWEVFPIKPMSFNLSLNSGFIKAQIVTEINCSLKFHLDRFYLQSGYIREAVGSEAINGIIIGIGLNF